uniref:Uncharacterized protein n=1 Tax=Anser brachyrhynchus TaxID=132585 RepID=A0A8B9IBH1_9AVES
HFEATFGRRGAPSPRGALPVPGSPALLQPRAAGRGRPGGSGTGPGPGPGPSRRRPAPQPGPATAPLDDTRFMIAGTNWY